MAFTDVTDGSRRILEGIGPVKITLGGDVKVGDLIGYNAGWVTADANGTYPAILVAGFTALSGAEITAYRSAKIGGLTTGTAGNKIYLSNTAGAYGASAGTMTQVVGYELGSGEVYVEPEHEQQSLGDNVLQYFGDASDVSLGWNGTNFVLLPLTDNTGTFEVGNDGTKSMDVKLYGATASSYLLWDNSDDRLELDGADINLQDDDILQFGDAQDVTITWDASNLVILPATDNTGQIHIGNDGTKSMDLKLFGATASYYVLWDMNGDTNGAFYFGADTKGILTQWYGDTTGYYVKFDPSGDTNGAWYFGADDLGVDVAFYGQTASNSMVWDASANGLVFTAAGITLGVGTNIVLDTATGTKLGTATNQKLGFFNTTPATQPAHVADPAGGGTQDAEARTAINAINAMCATLGLTAAA